MRYSISIVVFMILCLSASAFTPVRTIEPIMIEPVIIEPIDPPEAELPPEDEPTVVITKVDVSSSEILDINKEGSDPEEETEPALDKFQPETDVRPDGIIDEDTMEPMDTLDVDEPEDSIKSHGNPEPWHDDTADEGFVEGTVDIIGHPEIDVGKRSPDMPVDPVDIPPDPLGKEMMPPDPLEMPPDPLDKEGVVDNKYPENKPSVMSRMWSGIVRLFTWNSPEAKEKFTDAMESSDLAMYEGHGRYGSGPDMDGKGDTSMDGKGDSPSRIKERYPDEPKLEGNLGGKYYDDKIDIDASIGREERSLDGKGDDVYSAGIRAHESTHVADSMDVDEASEELHPGENTFWARVKSWFSVKKYSYNDLPEVDDEVEMEIIGEMSEEDMMDLDDSMRRQQQATSTMSGIANDTHDTQEGIIRNMR